jgi:hypothetical protein
VVSLHRTRFASSILEENSQSKSPNLRAEAFTLVTPAGFEPAIFWMRTKYPGPLDEGAVAQEDKIMLA